MILCYLIPFIGLSTLATAHPHKRHSECFSYNVQGCEYPIIGRNGAAASEIGTCSEIAIDILEKGGNAADGAVAMGTCVGVISAYHSGIGGGGFSLVRFPTGNGSHGYEMVDFRETLPAAGNATIFSQYGPSQNKSLYGGLAVGVPGDLKGWWTLHSRHGKLPWHTVFQPAINLARNGFIVNRDLAEEIAIAPWMLDDPLWAEIYYPNGTALVEGDTAYRPKYAETLERIANEGIGAFYNRSSSIAQDTVKAIQSQGGILTLEDLEGYEAIVRTPANITYRGKRIFSTVAPSSGVVVLSALKIFEGYDGSAKDNDPAINLTTHRLLEATEFAYGQRSTLADPGFVANVTYLEQSYLTNATAATVRSLINDTATYPVTYYDPSTYFPSRESGTSHMAIVDGDGMAVSLTTTVNTIWGSRVISNSGICFNNELDDFGSPGQLNAFGFAASPINYPAAGKRPLSSISSSIAEDEDGNLLIATGSAGGSQIITATLQQLYHYLDQGLNSTASTVHSRWHDQLGGQTTFELPDAAFGIKGYDNGTVAYLKGLGYNVTYVTPGGSVSQAIGRLEDGSYLAASDPRRISGYGAAF
ncbi:gamma-glutamyltranspeptidase [Naematelia encephala]|uniref:Glutathione hydrolase n=1 Tax=Naematelia encephala TaxID=71784 RepID=A0A1Y2AM82_9TREE|nr:gamma-glutamyltranspeptidase [Naematelia encephala]